ncbi:MAG: hypothetical protein AB7O24_01860 [Kofleriaceae bacterium]
MKRLATIALLISIVLPACSFVFEQDDDEESCGILDDGAPARNPETLLCGPSPACDSGCGLCPFDVPSAFVPSWPECGHRCEQLGEDQCAADPSCRVVHDAQCATGGDCFTNFLGCFPLDQQPDASVDCYRADASTCSRSNECTALHVIESCNTDAACAKPFSMCAREGIPPGQCGGEVTCRESPPNCGRGTTPGILGGCYTGACLPVELCSAGF